MNFINIKKVHLFFIDSKVQCDLRFHLIEHVAK